MHGLLLVGHGTRKAAGNRQFLDLSQRLAGRLKAAHPPGAAPPTPPHVQPCFLDHAAPGLPEGIDLLAAAGATSVAAVPLMLLAAGHVKADIPGRLAAAARRHPHLRLACGAHLGPDHTLVRIAADRAAEAGAATCQETEVLLVGRGSSDPDANSDLAKVGRLLWETLRCRSVQTAYCDVTLPTVPQCLDRAVRLGARRVILLPFFIFTGVLMDRLQALTTHWQTEAPAVSLTLANPDGLAADPRFLDLLAARAEAALTRLTAPSHTPVEELFATSAK